MSWEFDGLKGLKIFHICAARYGTSHVLVLAGFPPSTRTTELEKLLEDFRNRGVVIRWVNDTTALAVFRTPAIGNYILVSSQFSSRC